MATDIPIRQRAVAAIVHRITGRAGAATGVAPSTAGRAVVRLADTAMPAMAAAATMPAARERLGSSSDTSDGESSNQKSDLGKLGIVHRTSFPVSRS